MVENKSNLVELKKVEELFWEWWNPEFKEMEEDGWKFLKKLRNLHEK